MSCADVMYQPYSPYFSVYQRNQVQNTASCVGTFTPPGQTAAEFRKYSFPKYAESPPGETIVSPAAPTSSACRLKSGCSRGNDSPSTDNSGSKELDNKSAGGAHYLSANCVVFTYYSGDISAVVDEHFSRALSQASAAGYSAPAAESSPTKTAKDGPPMSHRNFPPSFWNSNYQHSTNMNPLGPISVSSSTGHPDLSYGSDPYHHPLHASLHHQNHSDPWHYSISSQTGHFGHHPHHHHRSPHDLSSYHPGMSTMTNPARFGQQYGSLLLQPSAVRSAARLTSACAAIEKPSEGWGTARFHDTISHIDSNYPSAAAAAAAYGGMSSMSESSNSNYSTIYDFYKLQTSYPRSYR